jgi:hypothetical protein
MKRKVIRMDSQDDMKLETCPNCGKEMHNKECDSCGYKKQMKKMDNVQRFDYFDAPSWLTEKFQTTPEGFLRGRAIVTNVGVFTYRNTDGTVRRELRLPEEVFDTTSLESLKMKPVTNDHPTELVTPENVKQYQVGALGDNPGSSTQKRDYQGMYKPDNQLTDGYHVAIDMCITEKQAIDDITNGKRSLSCGYTCDLEKGADGAKWCGMEYDYIQRNIRYNHVAIVDSARAGDAAKIRMDSRVWVSESINDDKGGKNLMLKKINLDGVEYEAEPQVITALTQHKNRADKAEEDLGKVKIDLSKMTADHDTQKERADKLDQELKDLKLAGPDQTRIDAAVDAKFRLLKGAELAGVEVKKDMKDADIRKAIITSVFPNANLDGKDEVYLQARFDGAMDMLEEAGKNNDQSRELLGDEIPNKDRKDSNYNSDSSREKMLADMKKASRGENQ